MQFLHIFNILTRDEQNGQAYAENAGAEWGAAIGRF
jgi:hypothetical protein